MANRTVVWIEEEYGYAHWYAIYSRREYAQICDRWMTMKNLNCLVPVRLVFPGAKPYDPASPPICNSERLEMDESYAHVHESEDSAFGGCPSYKIPDNDGDFEINGRVYTDQEIEALRDKQD